MDVNEIPYRPRRQELCGEQGSAATSPYIAAISGIDILRAGSCILPARIPERRRR